METIKVRKISRNSYNLFINRLIIKVFSSKSATDHLRDGVILLIVLLPPESISFFLPYLNQERINFVIPARVSMWYSCRYSCSQ